MNEHDRMLHRYARGEIGRRCGGCGHCIKSGIGPSPGYTCTFAPVEAENGTAGPIRILKWDPRWIACGLWTEETQ